MEKVLLRGGWPRFARLNRTETSSMLQTSANPVSLLKRLRASGETKAWDQFVELYSPLLFHWARRLSTQEADAADLVQEVFAILVRKLPDFAYDPTKSFHNWLRTVTLNKWRKSGASVVAGRSRASIARRRPCPRRERDARGQRVSRGVGRPAVG